MKKLGEMINHLNVLTVLGIKRFEKKIIYLMAVTIFILVNILLSNIPLRFDLSYGKAYTLSNATKNILHNNKNELSLNFFVSSDLPTRLLPLKSDVNDLLTEYKRESNGKLKIIITDPKKDDKILQKAKENGIPELQFSQLDKDKYAVTTAYFGILLEGNNKKESFPQVTDIQSLEYNLTAAIYKLTRKNLPKIGIIGSSAIPGSQDNLTTLKSVLGQQLSVESLDISTLKNIDKSYKSILVFDDNVKKYSPTEQDILRKYVAYGGNVIFFVDGVWISDDLKTNPANHDLFKLLSNYGVVLNKDLVLSATAEIVNFGNGTTNFLSPYPFWLKTNNFAKDSSYFSNIVQLTFPWTSSLNIKTGKNLKQKVIIKSTSRSWIQKKDFVLDPQTVGNTQVDELKEYVIGIEVDTDTEGKVIVIPSSRFVQERYLGQNSNIEFVLNIVNDLASEGALTGIRQRAATTVPLPELSENQKDIFKYSAIFILPALFTIYGAWRLVKRK